MQAGVFILIGRRFFLHINIPQTFLKQLANGQTVYSDIETNNKPKARNIL